MTTNIPSSVPGAADIIKSIDKLTDAVTTNTSKVEDLRVEVRHNKRFSRMLAVSLAFDIGLSCVLGFVINRDHNNAVAQCQESNFDRSQLIGVFTYLVTLKPSPTTPEQIEENKILAKIGQIYAPRNCG